MQRMQNPAMQGQGMERQGSQIDMTRSGSPNSGEAPSPKRQRLEGNMQMQQGRPGPTPLPQGNQQVGPPFSSPTPTMNSATLPNTPHMQHTPHLISTPTPKAVSVDPARLAITHQLLRDRGLDPTQFPPQQLHFLAMQPANHQQKSVEAYSSSIKQSMAAAMNSANKQTDTPSKGMPAGPQGTPQQQPQQAPQGQQGQQQGAPTPGQMQAHMQAGIPPGMPDAQAQEFYANNGGRPGGMGAGQQPMQPQQAAAAAQAQAANTSNGNHALQDYQMQLMLLEQQNKKRLLMARQEQDSMAHPAGVPANGQGPPQGFGAVAPGMSPQGSRAGDPSPGPGDMGMPGRGTPKIGKAGMSPNGGPPGGPEMGRASPSPAQMAQMHAGPGMMPPGQQPPQMVPGPNGQPMMRPPSSHPGAMGQPMTAEQMRMMSGGMQLPNGQWAQGGPQQGQVQPGPNMTPRQGNQPMPPPPPPGQQGAQPSSPAQGGQPPTPNQNAKNKGGKKDAGKKVSNLIFPSRFLRDRSPCKGSPADISGRERRRREAQQVRHPLQKEGKLRQRLHLPRQSRPCTRTPSITPKTKSCPMASNRHSRPISPRNKMARLNSNSKLHLLLKIPTLVVYPLLRLAISAVRTMDLET